MFKYFKILAVLLLIFVSACSDDENKAGAEDAFSVSVMAQEDGNLRHSFNIELADSSEKIYHGLMGRTSMDENTGMLFDINIVPKDMDIAFWMKDTLIPLDIIFIDEKGKIFYIHRNALPRDETPIYPPKRPRAVLELNAGQVDIHNIVVGDILKNALFGNN